MSKDKNIGLFNSSGCLTEDAIFLCQSQNLDQDAMDEIRAHLKECPICSDAMEGFATAGSTDSLKAGISELRRRLHNHHRQNKVKRSKRIIRRWHQHLGYFPLFALIILFMGAYMYFYIYKKSEGDRAEWDQIRLKTEISEFSFSNGLDENPYLIGNDDRFQHIFEAYLSPYATNLDDRTLYIQSRITREGKMEYLLINDMHAILLENRIKDIRLWHPALKEGKMTSCDVFFTLEIEVVNRKKD